LSLSIADAYVILLLHQLHS